jgi:hypothetical protein
MMATYPLNAEALHSETRANCILLRILVQNRISLAEGYPYVTLFRQVYEKLCPLPVTY